MCVWFPNCTALICPTIFNLTNFFKCTFLLIVSRFVTTCLVYHSMYLTWHMLFIQNYILCTLWLYWKCSVLLIYLPKTGLPVKCPFVTLYTYSVDHFIHLFEQWNVLCEHLQWIGWRAARRFRSLIQTVLMVSSWKLGHTAYMYHI